MGNVRNCWSLLCLGALIAWTTAAQAQNAAAARPPAPAAEEQGTTLGEVIVTAERRPERIEDVPASITAVSAETIEKAGVVSFLELGSIAPGVQVNQAGGATQPAIRGITSLTNTVGFENNVAVYIDGFYEPDMIAINSDLANVAGIEVLKGPQGTLYGRNATGGAILVNTLKPSASFTGRVEASYSSFDDATIGGFLSGPISDRFRFSIAAYARDTHGYLQFSPKPSTAGPTPSSDNAAPIKQQSFRAKLEADLTEKLSATLAYNYGLSADPRGNLFTPRDHTRPADPAPPLRATDRLQMSYNYETLNLVRVQEPTLKLEWKTAIGTLTSYTGYARRKTDQDFDTDGTYTDITSSQNRYQEDTYQQTVDLAVDAFRKVDLVVGASYYDDHTRSIPPFHLTTDGPARAFSFYINSDLKTEAYAAYTDATLHLTDKVSLNLGGRFSDEKKTIDMSAAGILAAALPETIAEKNFSKFTPRASIRYELAPRTNIYVSYSQGFRSGTFPVAVGSALLIVPIKPENVTAYEVGFKTARQRVQFDTAAFYYRDKDLHVSLTSQLCTPSTPPICTFNTITGNAPLAEIYGIDGQLSINPVDRLNIRAGGAYLHARYRDFTNAVGTGLNIGTGFNASGQVQDWSDQQMARAPTTSGYIGVDYALPVAGGSLLLAGNLNYTDSYVIQNPSLYGPLAGPALAGEQRYRQSAYTLLNAQVTWTDRTNHYSLGAFARNLTDEKYRLTYNGNARGDYSTPAWPRQLGVKLGYKF